jgi:hypothetical protein
VLDGGAAFPCVWHASGLTRKSCFPIRMPRPRKRSMRDLGLRRTGVSVEPFDLYKALGRTTGKATIHWACYGGAIRDLCSKNYKPLDEIVASILGGARSLGGREVACPSVSCSTEAGFSHFDSTIPRIRLTDTCVRQDQSLQVLYQSHPAVQQSLAICLLVRSPFLALGGCGAGWAAMLGDPLGGDVSEPLGPQVGREPCPRGLDLELRTVACLSIWLKGYCSGCTRSARRVIEQVGGSRGRSQECRVTVAKAVGRSNPTLEILKKTRRTNISIKGKTVSTRCGGPRRLSRTKMERSRSLSPGRLMGPK